MARPKVISGNWKMNMTPAEARAFFRGFSPALPADGAPELLIFPPALTLAAARDARPRVPQVDLGVQNLYWEAEGAFTGELSVTMAREAGASHALIGHSERRHIFGETNREVARKVAAVLEGGLIPVVCVGETLPEREDGRLEEVLLEQLEAFLPIFQAHSHARAMVAYEPVWAIGTGVTATPEDASRAHAFLRHRMAAVLGQARAGEVPILYGGSVKPGNAGELLRAPEVDGVLVGGASLDPASFQAIAEAGLE